MADYDSGTPEQVLAFDLRQTYAKILSIYMLEILAAKQSGNYQNWFKNMQLMYPVVMSRCKKKQKETIERYREIEIKVVTLLNKNKQTYLGRDRDPNKVGEIERGLMEVEFFLLSQMEKNNMFGTNYDNKGL